MADASTALSDTDRTRATIEGAERTIAELQSVPDILEWWRSRVNAAPVFGPTIPETVAHANSVNAPPERGGSCSRRVAHG